ncbi:hypothetical protein [Leminorella richardii]|uniref:hypothetical protein n=1 Tax=Leminorella richardii TaxID=158841 RepID=UPI0011AB353D|nr:hypothetical protein [Leminorella richardii]
MLLFKNSPFNPLHPVDIMASGWAFGRLSGYSNYIMSATLWPTKYACRCLGIPVLPVGYGNEKAKR